MKQCRKMYLLTNIKGMSSYVGKFCSEEGILLKVLERYESFELEKDAALLVDVEYLKDIEQVERVTVILKDQAVYPYLETEYSFMFDPRNVHELYKASYIKDYSVLSAKECYDTEDYYKDGLRVFDFVNDIFLYKGEKVYLTNSEKRYLKCKLLDLENVNSLRYVKYRIKKKLGEDFFKGL